jgi:hypothetical protein
MELCGIGHSAENQWNVGKPLLTRAHLVEYLEIKRLLKDQQIRHDRLSPSDWPLSGAPLPLLSERWLTCARPSGERTACVSN